jgi:hypothetical protein
MCIGYRLPLSFEKPFTDFSKSDKRVEMFKKCSPFQGEVLWISMMYFWTKYSSLK